MPEGSQSSPIARTVDRVPGAPLSIVTMLERVPSWADSPGFATVAVDRDSPLDAITAGTSLVLMDAALLDRGDVDWVRRIQNDVGAVVVIADGIRDAAVARSLSVAACLPASFLDVPGDVARSVLEDFVGESAISGGKMERFMRDAIHEFRTPLTVISEFAALCEEGIGGPINEKQRGYLQQVIRAADKLCREFDDYRDAIRLQLGTLLLEVDSAPLALVVADAVELSGCDIAVTADLDEETLIDGVDRDRLVESISRVVEAANKLSRSSDPMRLTVEPVAAGHEVVVEFEGLEPSDVDVRVMREGCVETDGGPYRTVARVFGLGVAMSKLFLCECGGDITLEKSSMGGGRFRVLVPTRVEHAAASLAA